MISLYDKHTHTTPNTTVQLPAIYQMVSTGTYATLNDLVDITAAIRSGKRELKATLPIATFSAQFKANRAVLATHKLSGYICVDFDKLEPTALLQLREKLIGSPYTNLLFISPSGNGVKWVVAVSGLTDASFTDTTRALLQWVEASVGFKPDAVCTDLSRACYLCYDETAYLSKEPGEFVGEELLNMYPPVINNVSVPTVATPIVVGNELEKIEALLTYCQENKKSLSDSYDDWFKIGAALSATFETEKARELFHEFSKLDEVYNPDLVDSKFDGIVKSVAPNQKIKIGTLYHIAKAKGVELPKVTVTKTGIRAMTRNRVLETYSFYYDIDTNNLYRSKKNVFNPLNLQKLDDKSPLLNAMLFELEQQNINVHKTQLWETIYSPTTYTEINLLQSTLDYIGELWDGKDYLSQLLNSIEVKDKALFITQFKQWAVSLIAQAYGKSRNDYALILVGDQGLAKTYFFENLLFNSSYVVNTTAFDPANKNHEILLNTKLLILLDEMASYSKSDLNQLKSCLSKEKITVDRKFQNEMDYKRNATFCGTSNNIELLKDATGDRRYLVFEVLKQLDFKLYDSIDKTQLWGQIVSLFKNGFDYKFSIENIKSIVQRNKTNFTMETQEDYFIDATFEITHNPEDIIYSAGFNAELNAYIKSVGAMTTKISSVTITNKLKSLGCNKPSIWNKKTGKSDRAYIGLRLKSNYQSFIHTPTETKVTAAPLVIEDVIAPETEPITPSLTVPLQAAEAPIKEEVTDVKAYFKKLAEERMKSLRNRPVEEFLSLSLEERAELIRPRQ